MTNTRSRENSGIADEDNTAAGKGASHPAAETNEVICVKSATVVQMKKIDETAICGMGIPSLELMEHAAAQVTQAVLAVVSEDPDPCVLVVCGTGNNGGDGLACARQLKNRGIPVHVLLVGDPQRCTPDSAVNAGRLADAGAAVTPYSGEPLPKCSCIVDAVFGFGLNREVAGRYREVIEKINAASVPVVACDIPSGLNGDTGEVMGIAVSADVTVSFTCAKRGLLTEGAEGWVGQLIVADIGIPDSIVDEILCGH